MNARQLAIPGPFTQFQPVSSVIPLPVRLPPHAARVVAYALVGLTLSLRRLLVLMGRLLLVLIVTLATVMATTHSGQVAARTLLVVPELLPNSPIRPLRWATPPPLHEEHAFTSPAGASDFDLYLPDTPGRHGAIILYTGAFGLRRDASFVQAAEALARSGAVVLVPESAALRSGEIRADEVLALRMMLAYLRERPEVDPRRIGIFGFSAGGSIVLLAAEDEIARDQIAFLNIFGAYYDAKDLLVAIASGEVEDGGGTRPWQPSDVAVYTFSKQVILALPDATDRDILSRAYLEHDTDALAEAERLSPDGLLVRELFERPTRERAIAIIDALPQACRDHLAAISPSTGVGNLRARLYLMHGQKDAHIPVSQAHTLAAAAPAGTLHQFSEFALFVHVTPDPDLDRLTTARELVKLSYHAWLVAHEYL